MSDRKQTNKYYPPDYDPKYGSINTFVGSHPLRDRARKLHKGILIVRFEMPFDTWCDGCGTHIARGVRFNAEKKQIGTYFTSKIWNFRMKCATCSNVIEINTDPEHADYLVVKGGKKKVETWDKEADDGAIILRDKEEANKLAEDPFYRLENTNEDKRKAKEAEPQLLELQELKKDMKDDFACNQVLRHLLRAKKKETEALKKDAESKGLHITLLPPSEDDKLGAAKVNYQAPITTAEETLRKRKLEIRSASVFGKQSAERTLKLSAMAKRRKLNVNPSIFGSPSTSPREPKSSTPQKLLPAFQISTKSRHSL